MSCPICNETCDKCDDYCDVCGLAFCSEECAELEDCADWGSGVYICVFCKKNCIKKDGEWQWNT